ncbi:regulatory protein RecX [Corynebacterium terpenotabidum]|uniref:Regulatory protein RecX n=1 Tax=Corynebacterium terpenotabidum Y-11 TaxID=1200352 RepID=S4XH13_9CORY|nr:regulatory protein RecX [Corynebacterium terpenotabidum]AGP30940.1 recombination regulator RecX [Corynebacterium terpenotabidum Y-11]
MAEVTPDPELVDRLRQAVAAVRSGETQPLVDPDLEKRLAPLVAKATRLINHRDRSVAELRGRLHDVLPEGEDPRLIDTVIERCMANRMLDDARFATEWVRQRSRNQRKSVAVLRRELRDKGVAHPLIENALAQVSEDDQEQTIRDLVVKKAGTVTTVPADRAEYEKALRRIVGVAARRGFPPGASLSAARRALDSRISELGG